MSALGWELIGMLLFMLATAFYSGVETGMISLDKLRLLHAMERGSRRAKVLERMVGDPDRLLGTTLVGTNLFMVGASVLGAGMAARLLPVGGEAVSTVVMTALLLIFTQLIPKAWYRQRSLERCMASVPYLAVSETVFGPVARALTKVSALLMRGLGLRPARAPSLTREEIRYMIAESQLHGRLSRDERQMADGVFNLRHAAVADVMMPPDRVVTVSPNTPISDLMDTARETGYSRLPVCDRDGERVVGIATVYDVLFATETVAARRVSDMMRPPQIVREDEHVEGVLARMKTSRQPMAVVVDDRERFAGIITSEDILEEIVGEIES